MQSSESYEYARNFSEHFDSLRDDTVTNYETASTSIVVFPIKWTVQEQPERIEGSVGGSMLEWMKCLYVADMADSSSTTGLQGFLVTMHLTFLLHSME